MANPADIVVPATANPAVVNAVPFITFEIFSVDGLEVGHMDSPTDGTQPHVIATDASYYPLTIKFTQHDAPVAEQVAMNDIPAGAQVLN